MIIRLYHDPDEPKLVYLPPGSRRKKSAGTTAAPSITRIRGPSPRWRETWPVRDYLRRLAKHLRYLDDLTLELADGTTLTGLAAKDFIRRYA